VGGVGGGWCWGVGRGGLKKKNQRGGVYFPRRSVFFLG